jgi:hypothetical protein
VFLVEMEEEVAAEGSKEQEMVGGALRCDE